eukprot:876089-Pelagomonas_calceolata.AAC.5
MTTVKEGRRAAEEAVAAEAAARKAAEEEAEAERLREAGIAEELQVIDLTRFGTCMCGLLAGNNFLFFLLRVCKQGSWGIVNLEQEFLH